MSYAFLIDTDRCTGCRACQVACKQWHDLPGEATTNRGSFENPPDLSFVTYKRVHMREVELDGRLQWLFLPEQCRHCIEAPCLETADDEEAIYRDDKTGAILFTAATKELLAEDIIESCPYNIPRQGPDGSLAKCDMCNDRVANGRPPACVQTCPTGTMNFGPREEMLTLGKERLARLKGKYPDAQLVDADDVSVIYLITARPQEYYDNLMAAIGTHGLTRQLALRKMVRPLARALRAIA